MSQYKPYPAYKDSGVEWLGQVPEHWEIKRLRFLATLNPSIREDLQTQGELEVSFLPMEDIGEDGSLRLERTRSINEVKSGYSYFEDGDVAFAKVTPCFENGKGALMRSLVKGVGFGTTELTVLRPRVAATSEFLNYAVQTNMFRSFGAGSMTGAGGLKRVPDEFTRNFTLAAPSLEEQKAITKRLDRETTRIDALITKKTRFIELLREKRQALITHAVTKGLDPNVKMKDSGVEWLGEVPEHWSLLPLKFVSPNLTVGIVVNPTEYVADEGLPFLYGGDIGEGEIYLEKSRRISAENSERNAKTKLMAGDLVTVRVGAPGVTAVVPPDCEGGNCASVMLIRKGNFDSDWLCYLMNSRVVRYQVEVVQYGAAQEQFNIGHAVDFLLPVPPMQEQRAIAYALNEEKKCVDKLLKKTQQSIELLKERRSALITAAVTGQIDLREVNQ